MTTLTAKVGRIDQRYISLRDVSAHGQIIMIVYQMYTGIWCEGVRMGDTIRFEADLRPTRSIPKFRIRKPQRAEIVDSA